jgi:RNA-directed DNA polymerase
MGARAAGTWWNVDLEKFFDWVDHDIFRPPSEKDRGHRCYSVDPDVPEPRNHGRWSGPDAHDGTPQGSPLSPLLADVLLDEVDKVLER